MSFLLVRQRFAVDSSGVSSQLARASPKVTKVVSRWRKSVQNMAADLMRLQAMTATRMWIENSSLQWGGVRSAKQWSISRPFIVQLLLADSRSLAMLQYAGCSC